MNTDIRPIGVLLAGGLARRMGGGDKPLRLLGGRPLLDHAIARIAPQCRALVLNANGPPERFAAWGLPVVADPLPDFPGPLAGVLAGMRWAAAHHPNATADLATRLAEARTRAGTPIACASSAGRTHPVVALWPVALADALEADLRAGMRKIDAWTARHGVAEAAFPATPFDPFFNVNTQEDLAEAERLAAEAGR